VNLLAKDTDVLPKNEAVQAVLQVVVVTGWLLLSGLGGLGLMGPQSRVELSIVHDSHGTPATCRSFCFLTP